MATLDPWRLQLTRLRTETGLSMRELARRLDCSHAQISAVELGKGGCSIGLAARWASECGGSLATVFGTDARADVLRKLEALSPEQFDFVARIVDLTPHLPDWYARGVVYQMSLCVEREGVRIGDDPVEHGTVDHPGSG